MSLNSNPPILTVIIPCYNHGIYLEEAIGSVLSVKNVNIEIVVINDGSTDPKTLDILEQLNTKNIHIINQENKGPCAARNAGIKIAKGKYILTLDSDNIIKPEFVYKSLNILNETNFDIVYSKPQFIGENLPERMFQTREFDIYKLLQGNFIDTCSIYNKEVWVMNMGYETNIPYKGFEDWEFWINSYSNGFKFKFIDEELFYYRITSNSLISQYHDMVKRKMNYTFILNKHAKLFQYYFKDLNKLKKKLINQGNLKFKYLIINLLISIVFKIKKIKALLNKYLSVSSYKI